MKKLKLNQIKVGAFISYFSMAFNIIAGLVYTPWMVGKIGQANYGLFTLATSLVAIFMLDFGLSSAVSRFLSKYRAEGKSDDANNIIGIIYKLYIGIDILILIVLFIVYFFLGSIYKELTTSELEQFKSLYLIVAIHHIIAFPFIPLNGILNAYEKFIQLKACDFLTRILSIASVVLVLFFSTNVTLVVFANVFSGLIVVAIKFFIVKYQVPLKANFKASGSTLYKTLFSFTIWTTIISIMQRFTHSFAPSVLGMTSGSIEIALYAPAVALEGYFYTLGTAINGLFLPRISRHIANGEEDSILNLMVKIGKYQSIVLGLVFIGFACLGGEFMVLWMGPDYHKSYYLTTIILFPTLISATQQIANTAVIAKKLIKYQALCMCVTGSLGLAVSFVLSLHIGAMGVCIGTALTSIFNISFMNYIYKTKAGINVFEFYKKCYFKLIPCYLVIITLGLLVVKFLKVTGWLGLILKGSIISFVFFLIIFFFYISKEEKSYILKLLKMKVRD